MDSIEAVKTSDTTRRRIIEAAEKLFAEKGFQAMTLRAVTKAAQVNLASVNYHFGSKTNLMRAVIEARIAPINRERLRQLDSLVDRHYPDCIALEAIFEALFRPLFQHAAETNGEDSIFMQMLGRALTEPAEFIRRMHKEYFTELSKRFLAELQRSCPGLSESQIQIRYYLAVGTMLGTITEQVRLENISDGKLSGKDLDMLCNELTAFVVAGFQQADPK